MVPIQMPLSPCQSGRFYAHHLRDAFAFSTQLRDAFAFSTPLNAVATVVMTLCVLHNHPSALSLQYVSSNSDS